MICLDKIAILYWNLYVATEICIVAREFSDLHAMLNETPCNNDNKTFLTFLCAFVTTTNGYSSSVQLSFLWQAKLLSASTEKYG